MKQNKNAKKSKKSRPRETKSQIKARKQKRRKANQEMTLPSFMDSLHNLFPEITELPHHDTLKRLLSRIDVEHIQDAHLELICRLIRNKKFRRYLIDGCYGVAIDGTQKMVRRELLDEGWLEREVKKGKGTQTQYYVYVLVQYTAALYQMVRSMGMRSFIRFVRNTMTGRWLDAEDTQRRINLPFQLELDGGMLHIDGNWQETKLAIAFPQQSVGPISKDRGFDYR